MMGVLEACKTRCDDTDTTCKDTCDTTAQSVYIAITGDTADDYEKEKRVGAGEEAATERQLCYKKAGTDSTMREACRADARQVYADSGADVEDQWYDSKTALLNDAVKKWEQCFEDSTTEEEDIKYAECDTVAKTYYTDTLLGAPSDWNEDDFETARDLRNQKITLEPSAKVDVKFELGGTTVSVINDKLAAIEDAVLAQAQAGGFTENVESIDCDQAMEPSVGDVNIAVVCRVICASAADAEALNERLHGSTETPFLNAVIDAVSSRRLRRLSNTITATATSSQVITLVGGGFQDWLSRFLAFWFWFKAIFAYFWG